MAFVFLQRKQARPPLFLFLSPLLLPLFRRSWNATVPPGGEEVGWGWGGGCRGHKSSGKPQSFHSGAGQEGSMGGWEGFKLRKTRTLLGGGEAAGGTWGVKGGGGSQKVSGQRSRIPGWWLSRVYLAGDMCERTAAAATLKPDFSLWFHFPHCVNPESHQWACVTCGREISRHQKRSAEMWQHSLLSCRLQ